MGNTLKAAAAATLMTLVAGTLALAQDSQQQMPMMGPGMGMMVTRYGHDCLRSGFVRHRNLGPHPV